MTVWNHPDAAVEMEEEAAYLERQLPGYGALFLVTAASLRDKIASFPLMFPDSSIPYKSHAETQRAQREQEKN